MSTMSTSPLSSSFSSTSSSPLSIISSSSSPPPSSPSQLRQKKMSVTQTYFLAHTARGKLSSEAARADHNLRLLVGHANLLDSLMLELAEAEQEQETWFNQSVKKASKPQSSPAHIRFADTIVEEPEEDWQAEDADSSDSEVDSDDDDEDVAMEGGIGAFRRIPESHIVSSTEEVEEDDEEFGFELQLTRSNKNSPPELDHDSDESSEDESMPPSPPSDSLPTFSEKQRQEIATSAYYSQPKSSIPPSEQQTFFDEGFYLPPRTQPGMISAIGVY